MADVARLIVAVGAQTRDLEAAFARSTRKIQAFADTTGAIGSRMSVLTAGVGLLGAAVVNATAQMDGLKKGLEATAGSAEEAERQMARLRVIAKNPGIDLPQAVKGSIQLQGIGASAQFAERTLRNVGRAVAASAGGPQQFESINRQLSQIAGNGKIMGEELNIIKESAPVMAKALQSAFGTTTAEGIRNLNLSTEEFFTRLNKGIEDTIPQVEGGLGNALVNLRSSIKQAFASLGSGQANELTKTIDRMAQRIEGLALAYSRLSPTTQRYTLYVIGLTAVMGPLLLAVGALANAYRAVVAISLVSSTIASIRAFAAQAVAVRSAAGAMVLFGTAARGAVAFLTGPVGIIIALATAAGAYASYKIKAAEAAAETDRFAASLINLSKAELAGAAVYADLDLRTAEVTLARLRSASARSQNVLKRSTPFTSRYVIGAESQEIREQADAVENLRKKLEAIRLQQEQLDKFKPLDPNDFPGGAGDTGGRDTDRFKALREEVDTLAEAVRLRHGGNKAVDRALKLERELGAEAAKTTRSFTDQVTLLGLANSLAEAGRSLLVDRAPDLTLAGPKPTDAIAAGLEAINRQGAPARAKLAAIAKEAERIQRSISQMEGLTRFADSLARTLGQFGGFGRALGEMVSRVGDLTDAMRELRESQQATGQGGIFANLSNLSSALGLAGAAFGALKGIFGGLFGGNNEETRRRQQENTEALERLSTRLNALAGTADETRRAQIAAGRLEANRAEILLRSFTGGQMDFVNRLIRDLGITFADLNRIAEDLGIDILKDNGEIAAGALDDLAKALGYHADLITRLGTDLESFRSVQDAAAKLYNLEDTPQRALSEALAELRAFAPELMSGVLAGIDTSGSAGREALQKALQGLFERIRPGSADPLGIADLGTFEDARALLESILRADSALDQFSESANKATAAMLNVPQGFKVALAAFKASAADFTRAAPSLPTPAANVSQASNTAAETASTGALTIPITIVAADDPEKAYAGLYGVVQQKATSYPQMRAFAASLAPPSRN
jgi:tape measure domain-containing protein